jgi:hypothetical protein
MDILQLIIVLSLYVLLPLIEAACNSNNTYVVPENVMIRILSPHPGNRTLAAQPVACRYTD